MLRFLATMHQNYSRTGIKLRLGSRRYNKQHPNRKRRRSAVENMLSPSGQSKQATPPRTQNSKKGVPDVQASAPFSFSVPELRHMLFSRMCDRRIQKWFQTYIRRLPDAIVAGTGYSSGPVLRLTVEETFIGLCSNLGSTIGHYAANIAIANTLYYQPRVYSEEFHSYFSILGRVSLLF